MPTSRATVHTIDEALLRRVSVVIPTLNEAESIGLVLAGIPTSVREIIVVDGLSSDGTPDVAAATRADVRIVRQTIKGKGAAIRAGMDAAVGEYVLLMDGDGSTDPAYIPVFARALADGADIAKGSRFLPGGGTDDMTFHRRLGNWGFVVLARILFGARFTDITYGYNAVRRDRRAAMALEIDGWAQEIVTNLRMVRYGLRVDEIPTFEPRRTAGVAKLRTWSAGWAILKAILAERGRPLLGREAETDWSDGAPGQAWTTVKVHGIGEVDPDLVQLGDAGPSIIALARTGREAEEPVRAIN
jgi:glycosyltransferase involved in cell wall biosynthesis